jgi:hypothetical protein
VITKKGMCLLIDTAISEDRNITQKEAKKILKYKDLTIDTQRLRNTRNNRRGNGTCNVTLRRVPATITAVEKQ